MSTPPTPTPDTDAPITPGTWRIEPAETAVVTRTRAMFGLFAVTGRFELESGEIHLDADLERSRVTARIAAASFASGNPRRDNDVTSAVLLDAASYPQITFGSTAARAAGAGCAVEGDLSVHGVTHRVTLEVTAATIGAGRARFRARTTIDRRSFAVTAKKHMVANTVAITIDAVATISDATPLRGSDGDR